MKKVVLSALAAAAVTLPVAGGVAAQQGVRTEGSPSAPAPSKAPLEIERTLAAQGAARTPVAPKPPGVAQFHELAFTQFGAGQSADVRVNLDLREATPREALKHVFDQTKVKHQVDEDVPDEPRITLKARGVRLGTAASLVAEAAGVNWTIERRVSVTSDKPGGTPTGYEANVVYRFGKKVTPSRLFVGGVGTSPLVSELLHDGGTFNLLMRTREERSTFNCPHCKGQTTMIRVRQQASCPKCARALQDDWQFCPADGTKRPAAPNEWRYCPICGKDVPASAKSSSR